MNSIKLFFLRSVNYSVYYWRIIGRYKRSKCEKRTGLTLTR